MLQERTETNWYTVKVQNNYERKVKERIELELGRNKSQFKIVVPMERTFVVKKGKKEPKERVKYGGYIFVETTNLGELMNIVRNTPGATNIVCTVDSDGKKVPTKLSRHEVKTMLEQDEEMKKPISEEIYVVGQVVKIIDGAFQDFDGTITWIDNENSKLKANVKIFGRQTPVELSFEQINKI